jgi:hypothetical protein
MAFVMRNFLAILKDASGFLSSSAIRRVLARNPSANSLSA